MSLEKSIQEEMKTAMKAKNRDRLEALRSIKSAIILAKTEKGAQSELGKEDEIKMLQRLLKQRRDSEAIYKEQGRADLAEVETMQADVIQGFLPAQLSQQELESIIKEIIALVGAETPKDMGKVMGPANAKIAGRAEGKVVAATVRQLLS